MDDEETNNSAQDAESPKDIESFADSNGSNDSADSDVAKEILFHGIGDENKGAFKCGDFYGKRADNLNRRTRIWSLITIAIFVLIITLPIWYHFIFIFEAKTLAAIASLDGANKTKSMPHDFIYSYYIGKCSLLLFLISVFVWSARVYNQLRRLKITYRDKQIIAQTYEQFLYSDDKDGQKVVRSESLKRIFTPTLIQSEKANKSEENNSSETIKMVKQIFDIMKPDSDK